MNLLPMRRSLAMLALALLAAVPCGAAETPAAAPRWTIVHAGSLLAVPGQPPAPRQSLLIKDGRIDGVRAGFVQGADIGQPGATVLDLSGQFVMPGLMDMHVHLTLTPPVPGAPRRADPFAQDKTASDVNSLLDGMDNARKTLWAGYTTVRNVGSAGTAMRVLRGAIQSGRAEGPRVLISGPVISVNTESDTRACYSVDSCQRAVREQIEQGVDLIKLYVTCSGSKPCGGKDAPALFLAGELQAMVQTARTRQLRVAAHAHGTDGINAALRAGVNSIEHGSFNDPESHRLFQQANAFLVPTLAVSDNIRRDLVGAPALMRPVMQGFLDGHPANVMAAFKSGVKIAAGSDAGVAPHGQNARELELYVQHGMPPMAALVSATLHGAALIGMSDELGSLEPGKRADLIALRGNPLQDIAALKTPSFVMKDGRIVRFDARPELATPPQGAEQ